MLQRSIKTNGLKRDWNKQKSSDSEITKSKNKIPLERFEQFAEFIEKYGYSIKYNQITFIEFLKN